jgi:hypothetical protein
MQEREHGFVNKFPEREFLFVHGFFSFLSRKMSDCAPCCCV